MQMTLTHLMDRWSIRRRQFDGRPETLDALYACPDPWKLGARELRRFEATNALIAQHCGRPASVLEVGCGEGYQTRYFSGFADHVTGLDISATALQRAQAAVPRAQFLIGELPDLRGSLPRHRYDLVTLCEVLAYGNGQERLLAAAQGCGDRVLATVYEPQSYAIEHHLSRPGWRELTSIRAGRKRWRTWLWSS